MDARAPLHTVDPRIYGQFVEHFGRIINGGLWAELLRNRKFYPIDTQRRQVADPWMPETDRSNVSYAVDRWVSLNGISAQRVLPHGNSRSWRGISQTGFDVLGGREYAAYAWIKADRGDQNVAFRLEAADGAVAAHAEAPLRHGDWQKVEARLTPDRSLRPAVFRIAFNAVGIKWIGAASLMPADNVEGLRRDVLELVKSMGPPVIRWPGGGYADCYDWRRAVGDRDRRQPQPILPFGQPYGYDHGMDPNDFGTDEYLRFCARIGADPYITANFGSGTPEMAASWVEYCNGAADSKWGAVRAVNGRREPYRVKHWSIGNEIWLDPAQVGHTTAEGYATYYVPIAKAMKATDPTIAITAVGQFDNVSATERNWNDIVLSAAWEHIDMLSLHHYYPTGYWPEALVNRPIPAYLAVVADPIRVERSLKSLIAQADRITQGKKKIQIAFDEWNEWDWDYPRPVDSPERSFVNQFIDTLNKSGLEFNHTLRDALFGARMLHVFMRNCERLPIAARTHMINSLGAIRTDSTRAFVTASGKIMELYRKHAGTALLSVEQRAPSYEVPEEGWRDIPYLDAAATISPDGRTLFLHLINLHPKQSLNVQVHIDGRVPRPQGRIWEVAAEDFMSRNDFGRETVTIRQRRADGFGSAFLQVLPRHSATTLEIGLQ
ncbi:MAG: hypothetical protein HXY20_11370 [Acidobacteria bacterium]|nr:hypothetical protein [Acidobacteriota bacterium]